MTSSPNPDWCQDLLAALELDNVPIDWDKLQALTDQSGHDHLGFIIGYAIGMAEGTGQADFQTAQRAAMAFVKRQLETGPTTD